MESEHRPTGIDAVLITLTGWIIVLAISIAVDLIQPIDQALDEPFQCITRQARDCGGDET